MPKHHSLYMLHMYYLLIFTTTPHAEVVAVTNIFQMNNLTYKEVK